MKIKNIFIGAVIIFIIYGEIFGIIHAIREHSAGTAVVAIIIPPVSWYFSIEQYWHIDKDWEIRIQNDIRELISIFNQAHNYKIDLNRVDKFSNKIKNYPPDKKEILFQAARSNIEFGKSYFSDYTLAVQNLSKSKKFKFELSKNTFHYEKELMRYYPKIKQNIDSMTNLMISPIKVNENMNDLVLKSKISEFLSNFKLYTDRIDANSRIIVRDIFDKEY
jgi:hypothetical protein